MNEVELAWAQLQELAEGYEKAAAYGPGGERSLSREAKKALGSATIRYNFSAVPVNTLVDRLSVAGFTTDDAAAQVVLNNIVKANRLMRHAKELAQNMCGLGDGYVMAWQSEPNAVPTIKVLDPRSSGVIYADDDDHTPVIGYRFFENSAFTVTAETVSKWERKRNKWVLLGEEPNTLKVVPFYHARGGFPYGSPEHIEAYTAQDTVDQIVVAHASSVSFMGWPQTYFLYEIDRAGGTSDAGGLTTGDNEADAADDEDPRAEVSGLRRDPGSIWATVAKEVGQLQAAETSNFISSLQSAKDDIATLTNTAKSQFSAPGGQQPSADSQREEDAAMSRKARDRRQWLSEALNPALELALSMVGVTAEVETVFEPDRVYMDAAFWQGVQAMIAAGVSREAALRMAGIKDEDQNLEGIERNV